MGWMCSSQAGVSRSFSHGSDFIEKGQGIPLTQTIKAILFDIGGTLVHRQNHGYRDLAVIAKIIALLQAEATPEQMVVKITQGEKAYKAWRNRTLVELPVEEKWSQFFLPDDPPEVVRAHAAQLQAWWGESRGERWMPAETVRTLRELAARGYIFATVSQTSPRWLREAGVAGLFTTTIHAAEFGRCKPHPSVFLAAVRACGMSPQECAYVGDRPSRDVIGAREAGIGQVILVQPAEGAAEAEPCPLQADQVIPEIAALLNLFPGLPSAQPGPQPGAEPVCLLDAALSTMWWQKDVDDAAAFFGKGRALGFARFELNHQIPPEVLQSIDLTRYHMGTLHDPCPAIVPAKQLEREDILVTALDENRRQAAVDGIKTTIEQAYRLGARSVVLHLGRIAGDHSLDDRLRLLYRQGLRDTPEYIRLRDALIADRQARRAPHLDALLESMRAIVAFTQDTGLSLGFENRFHYYELPIEDELDTLLTEFPQPWVGWQFDVGHLQVHAALGLMSFQAWLDRFDRRIIGVHFHDVQGIVDHRAPGAGDVDFQLVAAHLPAHAQRTLEVDKTLSYAEVRAGMEVLVNTGCVTRL